MKFIQALVSLTALSLVLTNTVPPQVSASTPNLSNVQGESIVVETALQPGENRITFQSEGEKMAGILYLPATYRTGDKLPAVVLSCHAFKLG